MSERTGIGGWWERYGGPAGAGLLAAVAAGVPIAVALSTSSPVKAWEWPLGACAAVFAGGVAYLTTRAETTTTQALRDAKDSADAVRERNEQVIGELLAAGKTAEAQRASTATAMAAVAGALGSLMQDSDADAASLYPMSLIAVLKEVLPGTAAPLRVTFLSRPDGTDGPLLTRDCAIGHRQETSWEIARGSSDALIAAEFAQLPWEGALLIDDVGKSEYRRVGVLVLCAPDEGVRSYCRAEVRYGTHQFGLLCADSWSDAPLTDSDKRVVEAFAAMLAVGLALG